MAKYCSMHTLRSHQRLQRRLLYWNSGYNSLMIFINIDTCVAQSISYLINVSQAQSYKSSVFDFSHDDLNRLSFIQH